MNMPSSVKVVAFTRCMTLDAADYWAAGGAAAAVLCYVKVTNPRLGLPEHL